MNERILNCIYAAVDEVNLERENEPPLPKTPTTPIHGDESGLDSLSLVNLVVIVEENLEREFNTPFILSDDRALSAEPSPFESIGSLAGYLAQLVADSSTAR